MELVVLGLGSNVPFKKGEEIFEPIELLNNACTDLQYVLKDIRRSSIWQSEPMYVENQCDFYNMVVCGEYSNEPETLLAEINKIEAKWGRDRKKEIRNGPRTLDIDIELFGDRVVKTSVLQIPHERLTERAFVLKPMLEILGESAELINKGFYVDCLKELSTQSLKKITEVNKNGRKINHDIRE